MPTNVHPLQRALARLGWSQNELARRSAVCQTTICAVLGGSRRRRKFSPAAAGKMLPLLVDPKTKEALCTLADLVYPVGEAPRVARRRSA